MQTRLAPMRDFTRTMIDELAGVPATRHRPSGGPEQAEDARIVTRRRYLVAGRPRIGTPGDDVFI